MKFAGVDVKLELTLPQAWQPIEGPRTYQFTGQAGAVTLRVLYELGPRPEPDKLWRERTVKHGIPDGAEVVLALNEDRKTANQWPTRVMEGRVTVGGTVQEVRLFGFFYFLEYAASISVVAGSVAAMDAARSSIDEVFASASPDFRRDEVPCLAELWA